MIRYVVDASHHDLKYVEDNIANIKSIINTTIYCIVTYIIPMIIEEHIVVANSSPESTY